MKELTSEQMKERAKAVSELQNAMTQWVVAKDRLTKLQMEDEESTWRNVKMSYWDDICMHYPEEELLNCYGDIFHFTEKHSYCGVTTYKCKRVLWDFCLSTEDYIVEEEYNTEDDWYEYEIQVDKEQK